MKQASGTSLPTRPQLFFVEEAGLKGAQRSKQSRAHVARVNRQRQKLIKNQAGACAQARTGRTSSSNTSSGTSTPTTTASSRKKSNASRNGKDPTDTTEGAFDVSMAIARRNHSPPFVPKTVAPVFGGVTINAFDQRQSTDAADMATYCFLIQGNIMDSWLNPRYKPTWWAAFFQHPLVYHSLSFSCGVMQDVISGRPIQESRMIHHLKTIQLVNKQLDTLDTVDIEPILLAIVTLWRVNFDTIMVRKEVPLLFKSHLRGQKWILTAGKMGGDGSHAVALQHLVQRNGGLSNFKTLPCLQESIVLADMLDSSSNASKPKFESIWKPDSYMRQLKPALSAMIDDMEGSNFASAVPGGLPASMLRTFQRLAALDKLLDDFSNRAVSKTEKFAVSQLATSTQHELLARPPWDQASTDQRGNFLMASHEACRIACLIYSLSVVLPVRTSDPWLEKLLRQLRRLLEGSVTDLWTEQGTHLLIWTLFVGGMSAFSTSHYSFFINFLRTVLQTDSRTSWPDIKSILGGFLWRDAACGSGAAILWQALQLD